MPSAASQKCHHRAFMVSRRGLSFKRAAWAQVWAATIGLGGLGCAKGDVQVSNDNHRDSAVADSARDTASPPDKNQPQNNDAGVCTPPKPPQGSCDPLTNDGCGSDQKCTALLTTSSTLALGCASKGDKNENDDCSQIMADDGSQTGDDCGDGLACFQWTGESSKCHRLCSRSACTSVCADGWVCKLRLPGIDSYYACGASCKPLDQSGCDSDQGCYLTDSGPTCDPAGQTAVGDECDPTKDNDCVPGSTCITGLSNGNRCLAFCSTSGGDPSCGTTCNKVPVSDAVMSQPNVGVCR